MSDCPAPPKSQLRQRTPLDPARGHPVRAHSRLQRARHDRPHRRSGARDADCARRSSASTTARPTARRRFSSRCSAQGRIDQLYRQPENRGKGAAIRQALSMSTGDIVIVQDADLEYDPADWPDAARADPRRPRRRVLRLAIPRRAAPRAVLLALRRQPLLTTYSNMLTNLEPHGHGDVLQGDARRSRALARCRGSRSNRFGFEPEITARLARSDARIFEVPISYSGRTYAEGKKIGWKDGVAAFWHITKFNLSLMSGLLRRAAAPSVALLAIASSAIGIVNGFTYDDRYIVEQNPLMQYLARLVARVPPVVLAEVLGRRRLSSAHDSRLPDRGDARASAARWSSTP